MTKATRRITRASSSKAPPLSLRFQSPYGPKPVTIKKIRKGAVK